MLSNSDVEADVALAALGTTQLNASRYTDSSTRVVARRDLWQCIAELGRRLRCCLGREEPQRWLESGRRRGRRTSKMLSAERRPWRGRPDVATWNPRGREGFRDSIGLVVGVLARLCLQQPMQRGLRDAIWLPVLCAADVSLQLSVRT
jgi:hypothetical protein